MKCTNCGMNNEEEAKFCAKCGTELKNNKTSRKNGKKRKNNNKNNDGLTLNTKRKTNKRIKIIFGSIAAVLLILCICIGIDQTKYLGVDTSEDGKTMVNKDRIIIDDDSYDKKIDKVDGNKIKISSKNGNKPAEEGLKPGTIVCSGVSPETPHGILKKIESVSKDSDGNATIVTKQAALTDIIKKCDVDVTATMNSDNSYSVQQVNNGDTVLEPFIQKAYALDLNYDKDVFKKEIPDNPIVEGQVSFTIKMSLSINWGHVKARITANPYAGANLKDFSRKKEMDKKELKDFNLPDIQFSIYVVPVVIKNKLKIYGSGAVSIHAAILKGGAAFDKEAGFEYESGRGINAVNEDRSYGPELGWVVNEDMITLDTTAEVDLAYEAKLYGTAGCEISAGLKGDGVAGLANLSPDEDTNGCIKLTGLNLNLKGSIKAKLSVPISGSVVLGIDGLNIFDGKDEISAELFNTGDAITIWEIEKEFPESPNKKKQDNENKSNNDNGSDAGSQELIDGNKFPGWN